MKTCAVILHYASDFRKCMEAAKKAGVDDFVLVDNSRINMGVGAGYNEGIRKALKKNCDFFLLLDDDNLLHEDALDKLKEAYSRLNIPVTCNRKGTRADYRLVHYIGSHNAVLGLNVFKYKQTRRNIETFASYLDNMNCGYVACAMFGGLFSHKSIIDEVGLPDEKFTMYAGDYEWTSRMGEIAVVFDAKIDEPESRQDIYEATKGHVMFQKKLATNKFIFWINFVVYYFYLLFKKDKVKRRGLVDGYYA